MKLVPLLLLGLLAMPVAAQPGANSAGANQAADREALRAWSRCLISRHGRQVTELLSSDFRSPEYGRVMRRLAQSDLCPMRGRLSSAGVLLGGELAEQSLAQRMRGTSLAELTAYRPERGPIAARVPSEVLAFCTVREAPQAVSALFSAGLGTAEERTALRALQPQVGQCLPAGESASFNAAGLRAILALGAYRLALHNQVEARR